MVSAIPNYCTVFTTCILTWVWHEHSFGVFDNLLGVELGLVRLHREALKVRVVLRPLGLSQLLLGKLKRTDDVLCTN